MIKEHKDLTAFGQKNKLLVLKFKKTLQRLGGMWAFIQLKIK